LTLFASGSSAFTRAMPSFTALVVPPFSWMVKAWSLSEILSLALPIQVLIWFASQPRPMLSTA
jgi:hypothetical protein